MEYNYSIEVHQLDRNGNPKAPVRTIDGPHDFSMSAVDAAAMKVTLQELDPIAGSSTVRVRLTFQDK